MNRTQKKCLVGSVLMHGLLVLAGLFGSAFFSGAKKEFLPVLEMIPSNAIITDGRTRGGGNPNVTTPPAAAVPSVASPAAPPRPAQKAALVTPKPPKPEPATQNRPRDEWAPPKDTAKKKSEQTAAQKKAAAAELKHKLNLDKLVEHNPSKTPPSKSVAKGPTQAELNRQRNEQIGQALEALSKGIPGPVGVEVPGPGGQAFINYRDLVASAYQRQYKQALALAGDIARGDASVDVEIDIDRSGRVLTKKITRRSGNAALDKLAQRVLDGVTEIAPFPPGASDEHRAFNLTFELKADRLAG